MESDDFETTEKRIAALVATGLLPEEAKEIVERQTAASRADTDF